MWDEPAGLDWEPGRSYRPWSRVEVWSEGVLVEADAEFLDGSVTERWVTGPRSSLSLSVPPTAEWLEWLSMPAMELRPFGGVVWGQPFEAPLGVFQVDPPPRSVPRSALSLSADDRWVRVSQAELEYWWQPPDGTNFELAARLMWEAGLGEVSTLGTRPLWSAGTMWDQNRDRLIQDYLEPSGAEAFVDRLGHAIIRDRQSEAGRDLTDGEDGTIVQITETRDWSVVRNSVAATSSKNDVVIETQIARITDFAHPAHESRIGRRTTRYSSPLITTEAEAMAAAQSQLAKLSAPALSWSVECAIDPWRLPGDALTVTTELGTVRAVVQEVTHPLGGGTQKLKLGADT